MHVDGACHCGNIAFEAEVDPERVGICHCTDCQKLSASAFRTIAIVAPDRFRLIRGKPKEYIKIGDSGNRRIQAFCADCGSGLYATNADGAPKAFNIRVGTLTQRGNLPPRFECWHRSALDWVCIAHETKRFDTNPS